MYTHPVYHSDVKHPHDDLGYNIGKDNQSGVAVVNIDQQSHQPLTDAGNCNPTGHGGDQNEDIKETVSAIYFGGWGALADTGIA